MRYILVLILTLLISCNVKQNEKEIKPYRLNYKYTKKYSPSDNIGYFSYIFIKTDSLYNYSILIEDTDSTYNYSEETQCYNITNRNIDSIYYYRHYLLKLNSKIGDKWIYLVSGDTVNFCLDTILKDTFLITNFKSKKVLVYIKPRKGSKQCKSSEYEKIYLDFEKKIILKLEYYYHKDIIYLEELQEFMYIDTLDYDFSNCN